MGGRSKASGGALPQAEVKRVIRSALALGGVSFTDHALQEMENDGITQDDAIAVLRGGVVEPGEFERGSWRYRVRVSRAFVVIAIRSESSVTVVTAWRVTQ